MPRIIGKSATVVEIGGLKIDELAGNVATNEDTISIARVTVSKPTSEPWLTLQYDEWLCVLKGKLVLKFEGKDGAEDSLQVHAGETAFVGKGERFKPIFPDGDTVYIPVCLPAFRPDRCLREEGEETSNVTVKLRELHGMDNEKLHCTPASPELDVLYHMCEKKLWDKAVQSGKAYFPPTFKVDGHFTHATAVPQRLIETANHFYTKTKGDWICLQLSRSAVADIGIITKDEEGLPVGDQGVSDDWVESKWVCPHIYGGIPTQKSLGVLTKTFSMERDAEGNFLSITGLTGKNLAV